MWWERFAAAIKQYFLSLVDEMIRVFAGFFIDHAIFMTHLLLEPVSQIAAPVVKCGPVPSVALELIGRNSCKLETADPNCKQQPKGLR